MIPFLIVLIVLGALPIVLGLLLGIIGVLLATIITIVVINDILGTIILFKKYFGSGLKYFVFDHVLYICVTAIIGYGCYLFCSFVMLGGIVGFGLKVLFCSATPNLLFLLVYCRTNRFKECLPVIRKTIKRKTVV